MIKKKKKFQIIKKKTPTKPGLNIYLNSVEKTLLLLILHVTHTISALILLYIVLCILAPVMQFNHRRAGKHLKSLRYSHGQKC